METSRFRKLAEAVPILPGSRRAQRPPGPGAFASDPEAGGRP